MPTWRDADVLGDLCAVRDGFIRRGIHLSARRVDDEDPCQGSGASSSDRCRGRSCRRSSRRLEIEGEGLKLTGVQMCSTLIGPYHQRNMLQQSGLSKTRGSAIRNIADAQRLLPALDLRGDCRRTRPRQGHNVATWKPDYELGKNLTLGRLELAGRGGAG